MLMRLHEWRARRGYSIQELADRAHSSRMTVFRIESGRVSPTVAVLEKLARAQD
jgi:transcriptional regulator with XRE-family HTH domain